MFAVVQSIPVVRGTGVNWQLVGTLTAIFFPILTFIGLLIRHEVKMWAKENTRRLDTVEAYVADNKIEVKSIQDKAEVVAMSAARIEGYLAASNGGGSKLPDVPVS